MPFKNNNNGDIEFIRLPLHKCVYGVEKGSEGKKYFFLRRFDFSGVKYSSLKDFAGSTLESLNKTSSNDDWIIPIKTSCTLLYEKLEKYTSSEKIKKLLALPLNSRPWFSIVKTPNNVAYFTKRRLSASSTLQAIGLTASLLNPIAAAGAIVWFGRKQHMKYKMARSRGEQDPSIMPKVFVHKIWQVSLTGDNDEIYNNISQILTANDVWIDWS